MNYKDYQYDILWITNKHELEEHSAFIEDFFALYEDPSNFPDPDELEEPIYIKERIQNQSDDPFTHLMLYFVINQAGERKFVGGCIVEFYPDSACSLVTYLFVDKEWRGIKIGSGEEKVGESLIKSEKGLKGLVKFFEQKYGRKVNAVFFESNNPAQTLPENDSIPPAKRLKFFHSLGARRIEFNYIQPPLGEDKDIVTNLFLLTFPELTNLKDTVSIDVVMSFLMELAKSLDQNKSPNSPSSYGIQNYEHDLGVLRQIKSETLDISVDSEFTGLRFGGRNIIQEMYDDLFSNRVGADLVKLVDSI